MCWLWKNIQSQGQLEATPVSRFKCPRCHRILQDIASLTRHRGLCPVPKCTVCQEQFVDLNQLQEHKKTHTKKRKATSIPDSKMKKRRRWNHGDFHCCVCLDSFITREELFHHKLKHMEDPRPYRPVEPHFNGEDERMNSMLRENAGFIFISHRSTPVSADFNFPLNLLLNQARWSDNIFQTLDLVANISNDESFKLNLSMGVILTHRETGELRFFLCHTPTMPSSKKRSVSSDHPLGENFIHDWTRNPWMPMWLITEKTPSGSHLWSPI